MGAKIDPIEARLITKFGPLSRSFFCQPGPASVEPQSTNEIGRRKHSVSRYSGRESGSYDLMPGNDRVSRKNEAGPSTDGPGIPQTAKLLCLLERIRPDQAAVDLAGKNAN